MAGPSAEDLRCDNCGSTRRVRGDGGGLTCADCGAEMVDRGHGWRPSGRERRPGGTASSGSKEDLTTELDVPATQLAQAAGLIRAAADAGLEASVDDEAWVAAALVEAADLDVEEVAEEADVDEAAVRDNLERLREALS